MEKCENVKEKVEVQNISQESFHNAPSTSSIPDEGTVAKPSTWAVMKRHRVAVLWSAFIAIAAINWGMDALMSTSTISIATFQRDFGYEFEGEYIISSRWQIGFNSASYVGQSFGAIISGYMADRVGKRLTMGMACLLSIVAVFVQVFARSSVVLLIGKLLNGITLGTFLTIPSGYAAEVCPVEIRGLTTSGVQLLISVGQLAANLVLKGTGTLDSVLAYKIPFALQFVFPVILLIGLPFCPESPWFLLRRSDTQGTIATLTRLGYLCPVTVLAEMSSIITHESKHASTTSYLDCFRGSNRRRTEIAMGVFAAAQATGVVFTLGYSSYFFELAGLSNSNAFTLSIGVTILGLFGVVCSWFLINRRGRRSTSLVGVALLTLLTLLIGILDVLPNYSSKGPVYGQVVCIIVFAFVYLCTIGPMGWALFAEIPSSALRSRTVGLGVVVQSLFGILLNIVVPLLINPDAADLRGKIGFIFAGTSALGTLWIWLRVPETAGRSFEELDWLFDQDIPARRFKGFVIPS